MIECFVCGSLVEPNRRGMCPGCGAPLEFEIPGADLEPAGVDAAVEIAKAPETPEDTDALIEAFRAQFERHELSLPGDWTERIRRMAVEFEPGRRFATVFFVDLCGYTKLTAALSTREHDELLRWYYGMGIAHVERHGGFVLRFIGDAIYAAFGAPWSFERDAESAIRAMVEIRDEVAAHAPVAGHRLAIRGGAASGPVDLRMMDLQGRPAPDLFGTTVIVAARLQSAAREGQVLVTESLAEQLRGLFRFEEQEAFLPKNLDYAVRPWRVLDYTGEAAFRRPVRPAFVGRDEELRQLADGLERVRTGGFAAFRIQGEAGMGKTRLAEEALASSGLRCLGASGGPQQQLDPFGLALCLLRQAADGMDALAALPGMDATSLGGAGYLLRVSPHFERVRGLPDRLLRANLVGALATCLAAAGRSGPLVVFVDDLQWADALSCEVLARLAEARPGGVGLVLASRSGDPVLRGSWSTLELPTLAPGECQLLLEELVDLDRLDPRTRRRLRRESEGVPLYLVELARQSREAAEAPAGSVRDVRRGPPEGLGGVPMRLVEVLQARLDGLSSRRRALLQCAAVLGHHFPTHLLQSFREFEQDLLEQVAILKGLRMLQETSRAGEGSSMEFSPTLLWDVAYHELAPDQLSRLHGRVAEGIEQLRGDRRRDFALDLAHHWTRAGEVQRARPYVYQAVRVAVGRGATEEAWELLSSHLQEAADGGEDTRGRQQRVVLLLEAGALLRNLGRLDLSSEHLHQARALAESLEHPVWAARAIHELAWNELWQGRAPQAERVLAGLPAYEDEDLHRSVQNTRGIIHLRQGRGREAMEIFRENLEARVVGSPSDRHQLFAVNNIGLLLMQAGSPREAAGHFLEAVEICRSLNQRYDEARALVNAGWAFEKLGEFDRAARLYGDASAICEELGDVMGLSAVEVNRSNLALLGRDWDGARRAALSALHASRRVGFRTNESVALENLALALSGLGLVEDALAAAGESASLGVELQEPTRRDSPRLALAWIALMARRLELARSHLALVPIPAADAALEAWRDLAVRLHDALEKGQPGLLPTPVELEGWLSRGMPDVHLHALEALELAAREKEAVKTSGQGPETE